MSLLKFLLLFRCIFEAIFEIKILLFHNHFFNSMFCLDLVALFVYIL
jgi:hypothetical protein